MLSASLGAVLTSLTVTPFDVVKTRIQSASSSLHGSIHHSPFQTLSKNSNIVTECCRESVFCLDMPKTCKYHPTLPPGADCPLSQGSSTNMKGFARILPGGTVSGHSINGTWDGITKILRYEGSVGLYRGLMPTLVMAIPSTVIYYVGYENIRDNLTPKLQPYSLDFYSPLLAGGSARAIAASVISPLELIRTRMQAGGVDKSMSGAIKGIGKMIQVSGVQSLWRGLEPTLWRDVPFSAIYWAGYEFTRKQLSKQFGSDLPTSKFMLSFASGALSGTVAAILTTPFDVAKTVQQVSHHEDFQAISKRRYDMTGVMRKIIQDEGYKGLFRGISPRIAKVAPACAIMISSYEVGKSFFERFNTGVEI